MAFTLRSTSNWCHDFPKLARESGFYFNSHTSRVRVDWNRISSIDIDRVIRERDFNTVDENVNNVVDYCLDSEYDVKILDPNFVKLFRLSQLAVEYLLYCKQYLDQSVVILKEELKYKLEENVKLKEEVDQQQNVIKEIKEKIKDKKSIDMKSESHGEIHKCPHCPKTFVSASFANAHLFRRHAHLANLSTSSLVQDEYRAETEKLHNEIKTLKERLNQTERVIHSEAKIKEKISNDDDDSNKDEQYRKYQEEISNLKSMLFTEIRNIKKKDSNINQQETEANQENIKELMNHQENEIQRLKNQLHDHLTSNSNEVQLKLAQQESHWRSKLEQLEQQHRRDIESLFAELKLTQESANRTKTEYEEKVSFLERQSCDQSRLLHEQSERLSSLKRDYAAENNSSNVLGGNAATTAVVVTSTGALTEHQQQQQQQTFHRLRGGSFTDTTVDGIKAATKLPKKTEVARQKAEENTKESSLSRVKSHAKKPEKIKPHKKTVRGGNKYSSLDESGKSETSSVSGSDMETDEDSDEETSESSATHTESTDDDDDDSDFDAQNLPMDQDDNNEEVTAKRKSSIVATNNTNSSSTTAATFGVVRKEIRQEFEDKLRDMGLDPEWTGIPVATYKQKMESIKHQQAMALKGIPKYEQIKKNILEELTKKIFSHQKSPKRFNEPEKKSFLNKAMKNVKSKALKAFQEFKVPKGYETPTPVMSPKKSSPRDTNVPKRRLSLELLPKKPTNQDIQNIKRQALNEGSSRSKREKNETSSPLRKTSLSSDDGGSSISSSILAHHKQQQQLADIVMEPIKARGGGGGVGQQQQRNYQSIEDFIRDIEEQQQQPSTNKPDGAATRITSTPSMNARNLLQDSYAFTMQESATSLLGQETSVRQSEPPSWASPKNSSKSVLKSTTGGGGGSGTMSNMVKKKVLFDLEKDDASPIKSADGTRSFEEFRDSSHTEKREIGDGDWNSKLFSVPEENEFLSSNDRSSSTENIQLKTSQSEKIAEISRKIQEKLEASRRKPTNSVEAMFSSRPSVTGSRDSDMAYSTQSTTAITSSILETLSSHMEPKPRINVSHTPRPAPRRQISDTKDLDPNVDVGELLAFT
ncbi:hypothetical protein TKK_0007717 [Trichogramma kaykai]|uniref:C2H2-type domain-containing protein n=1 Tax=Trichogramma kaykai TaxID=54128 RepID=A0ABD2X8I5_9HYME